MFVRDLMTTRVDFINQTDTIQEAAEKMREDNVGALPVFEGNFAVGMLTDRDIAIRAVAQGKDPNKTKVSEIMSRDLFFCNDDMSVDQVSEIMKNKQVRRLPVKNSKGHVIGMISLADLSRSKNRELASDVLMSVVSPAYPPKYRMY